MARTATKPNLSYVSGDNMMFEPWLNTISARSYQTDKGQHDNLRCQLRAAKSRWCIRETNGWTESSYPELWSSKFCGFSGREWIYVRVSKHLPTTSTIRTEPISYLTANGATDPNGPVGQQGAVAGHHTTEIILIQSRCCSAHKLYQPDERQLVIDGCQYPGWNRWRW